jgi:hypothetical protein
MIRAKQTSAVLAICAGFAVTAGPARAGDATTVKLIELLVKNGVVTRGQATALLREAQSESGAAPTRRKRVRTEVSTTPPAGPPGDEGGAPVHVTYVPPLVRDQIAAEVKQQVMQEAENEGWADQYGAADWTRRIRVGGDFRLRSDDVFLPGSNYNQFLNFNSINSSANGFDTNPNSNAALPPFLNTNEGRYQPRLRARIFVAAQVADWIDAKIQIATGNDNSPVSENQTLGQLGTFSKYNVYLDLAYLRAKPASWLTLLAGRSYNPFWTTNLLFYDDLRFDGVAAQVNHPITGNTAGFINAGAFPVFNNAFNFGTLNDTATQLPSHNAYLLAAQGGIDWKVTKDYQAKFAAGYFDFLGVEGSESAPCVDPVQAGACNTDATRQPGYESYGNTFIPLRDILVTTADNQTYGIGKTPNPEYYGLASRFGVLDLHGQFKVVTYDPINVTLSADFVDNLAFNRSSIVNRISSGSVGPANNLAALSANGVTGPQVFVGGNTGYDISLSVGHDNLDRLWDWSASVAYKYLESDAVLDSITDPNFHNGGTNAKGYVINGNLGLARNTYLSTTYYAAQQVSGAPYVADVLFVDLNAKF